MSAPSLAVIRFALVNRRTRETVPCWLATCSFADGPGLRVRKMSTTRDRSRAARFTVEQARTIAVQFSNYPAALERPDGTPLVSESEALRAEQIARHAEVRAMYADLNRELAAALAILGGAR